MPERTLHPTLRRVIAPWWRWFLLPALVVLAVVLVAEAVWLVT